MKESDLELARDYLDGRIDKEGLEKLNRLLETDANARAEFRAMATLEEGLRDLSVGNVSPFPSHGAEMMDAKQHSPKGFQFGHLGLAAMLLLFLGLSALLWNRQGHGGDWGESIAKIEYLDGGAVFAPEHQLPDTAGSYLGKGWVQLQEGRVRILFRSGATVELDGRTVLGLDTSMRAFLDFGKVTVHAPEPARDFVVATESMEVVDLGTRFEVGVDPNTRESNISVIEGLVDLHLGSRGAERTIQPLAAGDSARVDASGKIVGITNTPVTPAKAGILAHWTFDVMGETGEIEDTSGNQLHGHLQEGTTNGLVRGIRGQAIEFTGQESVDLCKHVPAIGKLDSFTFSAWVCDPDERLAMVFSLSSDTEQQRVQLYLAKRFVRYGWQDGLHFDSISGRVDGWDKGRWYHLAVASQDGVVRLYRDGELLASGSLGSKIGTPASNPSRVKDASHAYLGRLEDGMQGKGTFHQWYKGQMDEVQVYSGALGQEAIRFLHENPGKTYQAWEQGF
jgi:ferric-dicitrate binding protein FerR (iron transport regulator)